MESAAAGDLLDSSTTVSALTYDAARVAEVNSWLKSQFESIGRPVPAVELNPRAVSRLHSIASVSGARSRAAGVVAADLRQKAAEYRAEAARIKEILEAAGISHLRLTPTANAAANDIAAVANLLNVRDTEMTSFMVGMGELSLRKADVEDKRAKVQKESKILLDCTRKAIAKLNDLKKTLAKFENDIPAREAQMVQWQTNLKLLDQKEQQYMLQLKNFKALLTRVGYSPEINHGVLMEMAEHRKDLMKKTVPIVETLRSYQDLPPDKTLAALAIEEKKRQYASAQEYLEQIVREVGL